MSETNESEGGHAESERSRAESARSGEADAAGRWVLPSKSPMVVTNALALVSIGLGFAIAPAFVGTELQATDPGSGHTLVAALVGAAAGTLFVIAVNRFDIGDLIGRGIMVGMFGAFIGLIVNQFAGLVPGIAVGGVVFALVWFHPEWYVLNAVGVGYIGAAIAFLGVSVVPHLVALALVATAVYDGYSVYVSEHMQTLVEAGSDLEVPMGFVVPRDLGFSLREADSVLDTDAEVALLGYGDALFPGLLAVSAGHFLDAPTLVDGVALLNGPAVGALVGGVVGMIGLKLLLLYVEGAQPALVVLNPAVIGGYLVGAVAAGVPLATALGL